MVKETRCSPLATVRLKAQTVNPWSVAVSKIVPKPVSDMQLASNVQDEMYSTVSVCQSNKGREHLF